VYGPVALVPTKPRDHLGRALSELGRNSWVEDCNPCPSLPLLEETARYLPMGLLSLLGRVSGKRGSADFCGLGGHDVVVLVDDSTRMLKKGRVSYQTNPRCTLCSSILGERGDGRARHKSLQIQQAGIKVHFLNQRQLEGINLKVGKVSFRQVISVRTEAKPTMRQTKSKTRKLFKETTLYFWATDRGSVERSI